MFKHVLVYICYQIKQSKFKNYGNSNKVGNRPNAFRSSV
jgi:hypothetical protein